jgi:hypothetical protein
LKNVRCETPASALICSIVTLSKPTSSARRSAASWISAVV